jgi:lipopolysaccharide biosynthesis glycosyltransferase
MGEELKNMKAQSYYTVPIYYRLRFPSLLSQEEKSLYLDADLIISEDLQIYLALTCQIITLQEFLMWQRFMLQHNSI